MFDKNFNAEKSIKKWANGINITGSVIMILSFIAAIVLLCVNIEYLWWISLIVLGGGGLVLLGTAFSSTMIWGYGDIVGRMKSMSNNTEDPVEADTSDELPEL